jgi:hypothetical protein
MHGVALAKFMNQKEAMLHNFMVVDARVVRAAQFSIYCQFSKALNSFTNNHLFAKH